jgi:hypothetical protein
MLILEVTNAQDQLSLLKKIIDSTEPVNNSV